MFLLNWSERFLQYKGRDFYIVGESYAGHYNPRLAQAIVRYQLSHSKTSINLKGYMVGNGPTDDYNDQRGVTKYMWSAGLISDQTYKLKTLHCTHVSSHCCMLIALPFKFVKERVDLLDKEKLECKYTVIEGAGIGKKLESAAVHIKFETSKNGGSLCKIVAENKPLSGVEYTEEDINVTKNAITGMFKAIEAYLIANPDAYA